MHEAMGLALSTLLSPQSYLKAGMVPRHHSSRTYDSTLFCLYTLQRSYGKRTTFISVLLIWN